MAPREALQAKLGHRFGEPGLLEQALTHRSHGAAHNERLEFLGDGVLGCVVAHELYARFPSLDEGQLTRLRASLVREESLAAVAGALGVAEALRLGEGERAAGGPPRESILADALEAVVGAVFLDSGYEAARTVVLAMLAGPLGALDPQRPAKDAKTRLQEILQARHRPLPEYRVAAVRGEPHRQEFEVECRLKDAALAATGTGTSRQRAEQDAARALLEKLG